MNNYYKIKRFLLGLFFPKFCLSCQREGSFLCQDCRALLDICEYNYCLCDSKHQGFSPSLKQGKCNKCSDKKLAGLYFALPYKENLLTKKLIYQFKYEPYLKGLAKIFASILIEHFIKTGKNTNGIWSPNGLPAVLIPVPLDKNKLKLRGYNQSEELAKELARTLNLPMFLDVLIKTKTTESQMALKKEEREKNLNGAFTTKNPEKIQGKKIFLVDDVYTTGSTMSECANVLRKAGAKSVWGICIAREE